MASLHHIALMVVAGIALVRSISVVLFTVRTLLRRRDFVAAKLGRVEYSAIPEPVLMALLTIFLFPTSSLESPSLLQQAGAILGAILALGGGLFSLWTLPSMGSGHYVLPDQKLVDKGPYGLVPHPIYLFAFLVWLALSVGYASIVVLAVFVVYSMPVLVLYAREEEKLMVEQFGQEYREYREYQKRVGMFFPRA
jgi:protein-S-isoprenylcysteine O-methyltransferase Ste14